LSPPLVHGSGEKRKKKNMKREQRQPIIYRRVSFHFNFFARRLVAHIPFFFLTVMAQMHIAFYLLHTD
jgi:hypothetical protein